MTNQPKRHKSIQSHTTQNTADVMDALGDALSQPSGWASFAMTADRCLSEQERASMAMSLLSTIHEDRAYLVSSMAIFGVSAGEVR